VKRFVFAVPGDLATPTGGYAYDRRMVAELTGLGWDVEIADIGNEFPRPSVGARESARARLIAVPADTPIVVDGLAFGVLPELAAELHRDHPLLALVHHPLALESGTPPAEAEEFHRRERAALAHTDRVIVTSPSTARRLSADYAVAAERITVALPGSEPRVPKREGRDRRNGRDSPLALLAVGAVVRRKGYDVLIDALASLGDLPWRMTIAGDRTRAPATVAALEAQVRRHDLGSRIEFAGAVDDERLAALHAEADLFVLPSRFEGYGIAFAEAIAHGLPVIGTTAGAIPDTVPDDAGILVPPDDAAALAQALRRLIGSGGERESLAAAARAAAARLPTWRQSAEAFARAIEAVR
jgi:glycosyltransferase involved in cell wall biosynthesis